MSKHLCLRCDSLFGRCIPLIGQGCKAKAEQDEAINPGPDICISLALADPEANHALWGSNPPKAAP